jgi:DNA-binding HxlR family transcriptional regulator
MACVTRPEPSTAQETHDVRVCDAGLRHAFAFLGKRWSGVILATMGSLGPAGFADLKRAVTGITDSMLSDRLTELASIGLVRRTVASGKPPTVTYVLTEEGARLLPVFEQLARWAQENLAGARPATGPQRAGLS